MQPIIMLVLLTLTLAFGLTGPWGERLAPAAIAQVSPGLGGKTSPDQTATQVTPSPDGIALSEGDWVYYLAPPGNRPRKLVKGLQPALSPDGKKLAYGLGQKGISGGGIFGLMLLDLATGQTATLLPPLPKRIDHPAWSPRGDLLVFIHNREINIIRADGSGRRKIFTMPDWTNLTPQWASDGKSLFISNLSYLFQIDLAGQELAKTPLNTFTGGKIAVSSADRFLLNPQDPQLWAFTGEVDGTPPGPTNPLFLFDTRTQKRSRLTPADMSVYRPCWSLDGQYLYFLGSRGPLYSGRENPAQFYRINRDGTGLMELRLGEGVQPKKIIANAASPAGQTLRKVQASEPDINTQVGPETVWKLPDHLYDSFTGCDEDLECLMPVMKKGGASPQAMAFTRMMKDNCYLENFKEMGQVDLAEVFYPSRANTNRAYFLVNGSPALVSTENVQLTAQGGDKFSINITKDPLYAAWSKRYSDLSIYDPAVFQQMQTLPDGRQSFIFAYVLIDGPRAGKQAGWVLVAFDFDGQGRFLQTRLVRLTREIPK